MNIAELAEKSAARLGEKMVLDFEGQQYTNWQILDKARRLQRGFAQIGLRQGDVVALCMMNHPAVYSVFQGIFRNGGTALPIMPNLMEPEVWHILRDSQAHGVVTDAVNLAKIRAAAQGMDQIRWIAAVGIQDDLKASPPLYSLETLFAEKPMETLPKIEEDDLAILLYTGGTTGRPKGVMLTHKNLYASAQADNEANETQLLKKPKIRLTALPMAHIFGVSVMNGGYLVTGAAVDNYWVQMSWFDAEKFMQLIEEYHVTMIAVVPAMLLLLLNHPKIDRYDLSSLEEVVCGAAHLPVEVATAFQHKCNCQFRVVYGQTESTGLGSTRPLSLPYKPGSSGKAYYNTELKIFNDNDEPVSTGERGEIVLRGPSVMKGYLNNPEETAEALRGGWLHTGDIGYLDEDGYLFVVDRKKDMIIKGGENIYPAELEKIIYKLPAVAEAAVIGKPDPVLGEKVVAYLALKPGSSLTKQEVKDCFKGKVSSFKVPSEVHFIDALPKSAAGKILKRELRDRTN